MPRTARRIVFLVYERFQLLDVAGPLAAFEAAETRLPGSYQLQVCASAPAPIRSSSGAALLAQSFSRKASPHTLMVSGGAGTGEAAACRRTKRYVKRCFADGARVASVCSGTYILAEAGVLDGLAATTHWSRSSDFARRYPQIRLEPDQIFVRCGKVWSSAGVTAGIDLALALITEDLGEALARRVAQELVVYYRRPGGQSQFSPLLDLEHVGGRFEGLLDFMRTHLESDLGVDALAAHVGMSSRNFSRAFHRETGVTPGSAVQRVRAEAARAQLEQPGTSVKQVALRCGFGDAERMRRTFQRLWGTSPAALGRGRPRAVTLA